MFYEQIWYTCALVVSDVTPNFTRLALEHVLTELHRESLLLDRISDVPLMLPGVVIPGLHTLCRGEKSPYFIAQLKYLNKLNRKKKKKISKIWFVNRYINKMNLTMIKNNKGSYSYKILMYIYYIYWKKWTMKNIKTSFRLIK